VLKRFFAVLTTAVLALGLSLGATAPVSANSETCNSIGYTKFDASSGSETLGWGTLTWSGQSLSYVLGDGWSVDLCIKSGSQAGTTTYQDVAGSGTLTISQGISHIGYKDPTHANGLTCDAATLYKSSPLTNGDHINMDVVIDGSTQQVNAYVDLWQTGGPTPKLSNYVLTITPKSGAQFKVSLPQASVDSGILSFEYSSGWTGSWTVEWVQYNSSYFNQDRDSTKFLHCQTDISVSVSTVPSAAPPTCEADGSLVIPTQANIIFTGGTSGAGPGTYTITAAAATGYVLTGPDTWTITVLARGSGVNCEKSVEPTLTISECDATSGAVVTAFITIPSTTPHLIYSIGATDYTAGQKVTLSPGSYTVTVTAASGWTNTGPASYQITIAALGCDKAVEPTLTAGECDPLTGPVNAFITIPTTTPHLIYSIGGTDYAAGAKVELPEGDYTVDVRAETGWKNTGPSSFDGTVEKVECESVRYVQPGVTPQSCDTELGGTKQGALAFTLDPDLAYYLDGVLVTSATPILSASGPHTVKVVPSAGHYLVGGVDTFIVSVPAAVGCDDLYTIPLDPFTDPETCDPLSTDGDSVDGSITIVHVAGVQFSIGTQADGSDKVAAGTPATTGDVVYPRAAGDYYVFAESADPSITLKPGHDFWPLTVGVPKPVCLPTGGLLVADARSTGAVCDAFGVSLGAIVIEPTPGVSYAFKGGAALSATATKVAPGTYTIVATADDGLSTLTEDEWVLTVAATAAVCDLATLALTGQSPVGLVALGVLLLQAGLTLMAVRLIRTRRAPSRLAG
jgi:hypothetical protein